MFIIYCILCLKNQNIDFKNAFAQEYIPSGGLVFIELISYFNSYRGKCDVVIRLKKSLYGQALPARLWCEKLQFFCYILVF